MCSLEWRQLPASWNVYPSFVQRVFGKGSMWTAVFKRFPVQPFYLGFYIGCYRTIEKENKQHHRYHIILLLTIVVTMCAREAHSSYKNGFGAVLESPLEGTQIVLSLSERCSCASYLWVHCSIFQKRFPFCLILRVNCLFRCCFYVMSLEAHSSTCNALKGSSSVEGDGELAHDQKTPERKKKKKSKKTERIFWNIRPPCFPSVFSLSLPPFCGFRAARPDPSMFFSLFFFSDGFSSSKTKK